MVNRHTRWHQCATLCHTTHSSWHCHDAWRSATLTDQAVHPPRLSPRHRRHPQRRLPPPTTASCCPMRQTRAACSIATSGLARSRCGHPRRWFVCTARTGTEVGQFTYTSHTGTQLPATYPPSREMHTVVSSDPVAIVPSSLNAMAYTQPLCVGCRRSHRAHRTRTRSDRPSRGCPPPRLHQDIRHSPQCCMQRWLHASQTTERGRPPCRQRPASCAAGATPRR